MTFPTVPTTGASTILTSSQATATTTHTFPNLSSLPNTPGALLLAVIVTYQGGSTNAEFSGWGGGFTEFVDQAANSTTIQAIGAAYKLNATGSETGTFTVTTVASTRSAMFLMEIPAAHLTTVPEATAKADGTTAAADPAALNPAGWDVEDTLWVAVAANGETSLTGAFGGITAAPTNYTGMVEVQAVGGDVIGAIEGAVAFRQNAVASEDVGAFTVDTSAAGNSALLIAVRPFGNAITLSDSGAGSDTLSVDTGAIQRLQAPAIAAAQAAAATITNTFASNVTGGNLLVAFTAGATTGGNQTVTSPGATWTRLAQFDETGGSGQRMAIHYAMNAPAGATTVTCTYSVGANASFRALAIAEYSRVATASALDQNTTGLETAATATPTDTAMVTTADGDLIVAALLFRNATSPASAGSGYSMIAVDQASDLGVDFAAEDRIQAAQGSIAATFNLNSAAAASAIMSASFKAAAGGLTPQTLSEVGAAADTVAVAAAAALADSGTTADSLSVLVPRTLLDSGAAVDSIQVTVPKTLSDSGVATDSLRPAAAVPLLESAGAADQVGVAAAVPLAQSGAATDSLTVDTGQVGTLNHWLVGAPTTSGFTVALRTSGATSTQVRVSTTSDLLTSPATFGPATPDGNGYSKVTATGLAAGTDYYYRPLVDGALAGTVEGPIQTTPSGAGDFSFVFASCHEDSLGDSDAWTRAKARQPDFVVSTGDFGYADITTNDQAAFRSFYNTYLVTTNVADMVRDVPLVHTWSDHDYDANNGVGSSATNPAANAMYRYLFPHYPLEQATTGIYHSFVYRRVRFIVTDNRSFKSANDAVDNSSKTVLGATQKQWFKDTIAAATEPLIFWVNDQPWTGAASTPDDEWYAYDTERQELASFIRSSGRRVVILAGDMHALAADDGRNSPGGIPVFHAAPWRNAASQKGTPYLQGPYPLDGSEVRQYGHIQVTDSGTVLQVRFRGYDTTDTVRVDLTLTYLLDSGAATDSLTVDTGQVAKTLIESGTGSDRLCHDGGPAGAPDCILASSNLTGSIVDLWDSPLSPDAAWLAALDPSLATDLRVSFPTPATAPNAGGPVDFQVYVRRAVSGASPTVTLELWEGATRRRELVTASVTSTSGQLVTGTLDPADLQVISGAQVELRVRQGGPLPLGPGGAWTLQFEDQFSGTTLDPAIWVAPEGWTDQNNVTTRTANAVVGGGLLTLTVSSATEGALVLSDTDVVPGGGYMVPLPSFCEARVWFPGDGGGIYNWPAWWTVGHDWAANGEHDIAEGVGTDLCVNYWHNVPPGLGGTPTPLGHIAPSGSWLNAFHVYGVHRKASSVDVYWDGVLVRSYATDDLGGPHMLRFNAGVRDTGTPTTGAASQVKVDYVRVWAPT